MISLSRFSKTFFILLLTCIASSGVYAQVTAFHVTYNDSLITSKQSTVLYNNIKIANPGQDTLTVNGEVTIPSGWKNLNSNTINIKIAPRDTASVFVNLICSRTLLSVWQPVSVKLWKNDNIANAKSYSFLVKPEEKSSFIAKSVTEDIYLDKNPGKVQCGIYIKNTGNITEVFTLRYNPSVFNTGALIDIKLKPGKDTTYYYSTKIEKYVWNDLNDENINLRVSSHSDNLLFTYRVSRPQSTAKDQVSAYKTLPIIITAGTLFFGDEYQFYGGLSGGYEFGAHKIHFSYRSRQFSNAVVNSVQSDIFFLDYGYKKFFLRAGTFSAMNNFLIFGNSVSVGFVDGDRLFSLTATKKNRNYQIGQSGDNFAGVAKYKVGKIVLEHTAEANIDDVAKINAYTFDNNIGLFTNDILTLSVKAGVGLEDRRASVGGTSGPIGYTAGYTFGFNQKHYSLSSFVDHHDKNYPGFRRGMSLQTHNVRWKINKISSLGLLYTSNYTKYNYFRDSLYNSDIFSYNNTKYGIQYLRNTKRNQFAAGTGIFRQNNLSNSASGLNKNYYVELSNSHRFSDLASLSISTFNGISTLKHDNKEYNIWMTSSSLNYTSKYVGFNGIFTRNSYITPEGGLQNNETVMGGPMGFFYLFQSKLRGTFRLTVSKSLQDSFARTGAGLDISYGNKVGTNVGFSCYVPFSNVVFKGLPFTEQRYGFLTVSQLINIPLKQKYYDIKVVLFNDKNNNNVCDADEELLPNVPIEINQKTLFTNEDGEIEYKNLKNGNYTVGLYKAYAAEGLIPSNGPEHELNLNKTDKTLNVAFKKGRVISGRVKITQDALNATQMSNQYIKILATDSLNRKYMTLTDEDGAFSLYVPEGVFRVALEHTDFGGNIKAVRGSFDVDIAEQENAFVCFELKQKKREVRFLNQATAKTEEPKQPVAVAKTEPVKAEVPKQPVAIAKTEPAKAEEAKQPAAVAKAEPAKTVEPKAQPEESKKISINAATISEQSAAEPMQPAPQPVVPEYNHATKRHQ